MFDRFLEERQENPKNPVVLFFDESINAKLNRSKKAALTHIGRGGGKKSTDFLDDRSGVVSWSWAATVRSFVFFFFFSPSILYRR
jgi:hypothetical protein